VNTLPVAVSQSLPTVLATGALLKNRVGLLHQGVWRPSPAHGDLDSASACRALAASCEALVAQAAASGRPVQAVAHDLHPDFPSTRLALGLAHRLGVPAVGVQHHHAHAAAVLAEHGRTVPAVALTLDGHGLGTDGAAWGGEILLVDGGRCRRLGHLAPLALPGGDRAAREPWRLAAAVLHALGRGGEIAARFGPAVAPHQARTVMACLAGDHVARTTSAGRWFDAASAALGLVLHQGREAEAALALEAAANGHPGPATTMALPHAGGVIDLLPLLSALFTLGDAGRVTEGAALFHAALGDALASAAGDAAHAHGLRTVVLGGGCLANRMLRTRIAGRLDSAGFEVLQSQRQPPGDAGLALGQAWVAAHRLGAVRLSPARPRSPLPGQPGARERIAAQPTHRHLASQGAPR
jgi:hydrogenase maturation protein HypF